eukprot:659878-Alexandrium_andersonii.AAC.1
MNLQTLPIWEEDGPGSYDQRDPRDNCFLSEQFRASPRAIKGRSTAEARGVLLGPVIPLPSSAAGSAIDTAPADVSSMKVA